MRIHFEKKQKMCQARVADIQLTTDVTMFVLENRVYTRAL